MICLEVGLARHLIYRICLVDVDIHGHPFIEIKGEFHLSL